MTIRTPSSLNLDASLPSESPCFNRDEKSVALFSLQPLDASDERREDARPLEELFEGEDLRDPVSANSPPPQPLLFGIATPSVSESAAPISASVAVDALFESMASQMVIMTSSHEQKTTIVLDADRFGLSPLAGAEITITEFSTAPKIFNVEIIGNPSAVVLIQKSQEALLQRIAKGNFSFSIHRFEAVSAPRPPAFEERRERKEKDEEQRS
jgi:hypothetical protein